MKRLGLPLAFALLIVAASALPSRATLTPLGQGSTITTNGGTTAGDLAGYSLVTTGQYTLTNSNTSAVMATVHEAVLRNMSNNTLAFLYQETNTGSDPLAGISMQDFSLLTVSVDYLTDSGPSGAGFSTGTVYTSSINRTSNPGTLITFNYSGNLNNSTVGDIFVITTNQTSYNSNGTLTTSSSISSDGGAVVSGVLQPATVVPEPNSMILVGSAAVVLGLGARLRRRKA